MQRKRLLASIFALGSAVMAQSAAAPLLPDYPEVAADRGLGFPRDHGAHPDYRTEWWYFTGWLETEEGEPLGFQVTFFRSRPPIDQRNPSAFAPRQILFAHAALSDPEKGILVHDERAARAGFGIAGYSKEDTRICLIDWSLERRPDGGFRAVIPADPFAFDLHFTPTQPIMLNGEDGYSQKGPLPDQASHYYSIPHLAVTGTVLREGRRITVSGEAWLDREWSSTLLPPHAAGWDWTGINFDNGDALMAFQVRSDDGGPLYAGGTYRRANGERIALGPDDVRFVPRRRWRSPATSAVYPVGADFLLRLPDGIRRVSLKPIFDAQELDGRAAGMPVYWEGAVTTPGGRGYLELTGYQAPLNM